MIGITIVEYTIRFDVRLGGWIAFRVEKLTVGHKTEVKERKPLTQAKAVPHLAARALARILKGNGTNDAL